MRACWNSGTILSSSSVSCVRRSISAMTCSVPGVRMTGASRSLRAARSPRAQVRVRRDAAGAAMEADNAVLELARFIAAVRLPRQRSSSTLGMALRIASWTSGSRQAFQFW